MGGRRRPDEGYDEDASAWRAAAAAATLTPGVTEARSRMGRAGSGGAAAAARAAGRGGLRRRRGCGRNETVHAACGAAPKRFKWRSHFAESQIWEALGKPSPFAESPQIRLSVKLFFFQISFEFFN